MLSQLYIENIAVIQKAELTFHRGLNVLTGETGAGKSIIIDAIHAILGERVSKELVRTGASAALVSAVFQDPSPKIADVLEQLGYPLEEDGALLLQRTIGAEGKGSCRINGRPATVSALRELGMHLIHIHGQNESYDLLSPNLHLEYIDAMGDLFPLRESYQMWYQKLRAIEQERDALQMDEAAKARKIDLLTYQIDELESAQIRPGELEELTQQKNFYQNGERVANALMEAQSVLAGDEEAAGAQQALEQAAASLREATRYFPAVQPVSERINSLVFELEDCGEEVRTLLQQSDCDPARLEEIEERLDILYRLSRKYGETEEEMLSFLEHAKQELEQITLSEERREQLDARYHETEKKAWELARELSEKRRETSLVLAESVKQELAFLNMPGVRLSVSQRPCALTPMGCDEMQFLISTNPGEPPKPLAKIASGGELSRIMLSIKTVLADKDAIDTLIFDEVDTGVSGSAAQKVGMKLKEVSSSRQVLCITHSAQIAALADEHLLIQKEVQQGRTFTHVDILDFEGRKQELARIIGGVQVTDLTLKSAEEMLSMAGISKEG